MASKKTFHKSYGWITPEEMQEMQASPIDGQKGYTEKKLKKRAAGRAYRAKKK